MKPLKITFPEEGLTSHLLMTPLGKCLYRLEESEVFLEEPLYFQDVIKARQKIGGGLEFCGRVNLSGLEVCDFILPKTLAASEELQALLCRIKDEGGTWEMIFGGVLITHLPPTSMLDVEKEIKLLQSPPDGLADDR